ncbi:MAG: hypothetical protein J0L84_12640 [Verrucomicrobia bacterium]|nr:hypothetical protein [Verrucomicrobiota bacterium]
MKLLLRLATLLFLGSSTGVFGAALVTTKELNLQNSLEWVGLWTFAVNANVDPVTVTNPEGDPAIHDLLVGPWTVQLTVRKGYSNGENTYKMTFEGKHNPSGPTVVGNYTATYAGDLTPKTDPKKAAHGDARDEWSFEVTPLEPGKIQWVVKAAHVVPEPSGVAAVAATGLLVFGALRRLRVRTVRA